VKLPPHNTQNLNLLRNNFQFSTSLNLETASQEISQLKEKIKLYEDDLQAAKKAGDKEEVKGLKEEVKGLMNLLIELQKKENLLIANKGKKSISFHGLYFVILSLPYLPCFLYPYPHFIVNPIDGSGQGKTKLHTLFFFHHILIPVLLLTIDLIDVLFFSCHFRENER